MSHDNPNWQDPTSPSSQFKAAPPGAAPTPPKGGVKGQPRKRNLLATFVAVPALLLSAGAAVLSWRAYEVAGAAEDRVNAVPATQAQVPVQESAVAPSPAANETVEPTDPTVGPSNSVPVLDARTQYAVKYTEQPLKIPGSCNKTIFVDFDEPRMQVDESISEIRYYDPCGTDTPYIEFGPGVRVTALSSEAVTQPECADQIQFSPLVGEAREPVRTGTIYCLTTSEAAAGSAGIPWKMVLFSVKGISQEGTVALQASAWNIPN